MSDSSKSSSGRRPRRTFTPEFKAEAVAMVRESGGQIAKVARELNVYDSTLGNWVRQADEEAAGAPTAQELTQLAWGSQLFAHVCKPTAGVAREGGHGMTRYVMTG